MPNVESTGKWLISRARVSEVRQQFITACRTFHSAHSLLPGIPKQDLKTAVMPAAPIEIFEYALSGASELVQDGEIVRLKSHKVVLKQDEEQARAAIENSFLQAGLSAPAIVEVLKASGVEPARARSILQILLREGKLARVSAEIVLHARDLAQLRVLLAAKRGQRFSVAEFKDWTGVSRKYAIPLLEYFDREHVTKRDGDGRILL
jgi:selenocysteine-specific elongation factor